MKKLMLVCFLSLLMTANSFADGDIHNNGGKTCPTGQTCFASATQPAAPEDSKDSEIFGDALMTFLRAIFG